MLAQNESWPSAVLPTTELTRPEVNSGQREAKFRYLKIPRVNKKSAALFEPSELRIYGQRYEAH